MSAPMRASLGAAAATRDLWELAEIDDASQLASIIERGADINGINASGVTVLMRAAQRGRVNMVRALIQHGANLNATRTDKFTPLSLAAFFGHAQVVKLLVDSGASTEAVTRFETSAEMWAMARSHFDIADYLRHARTQQPDCESATTAEVQLETPPEVIADLPDVDFVVADGAIAEIPLGSYERSELYQADPLTGATVEEVSVPEVATPIVALQESRPVETPRNEVTPIETQHFEAPPTESQQIQPQPVKKTPLVISVKRSAAWQPMQEIEVEVGSKNSTPLVVRTLKDPPEIWDLVHETPPHFNPGEAFLTRLTSSSLNLLLAVLFVFAASGAGVYAFMKFRRQPSPAEAVKIAPKHVDTPVKAVVETPKVVEAPVAKSPEVDHPTTQEVANAAPAEEVNVSEPPDLSFKRSSSHAGKAALATKLGPTIRFTPSFETPEAEKSVEAPRFESVSKPAVREVTMPAAQPKKPSSTLSPQLIAPSETTTTPAKKPKVIQWP